MPKFYCQYCGGYAISIQSLTAHLCPRHPLGVNKGKCALYEGEKRVLLQILRLPRTIDNEPDRAEMRETPGRSEQRELRAGVVRVASQKRKRSFLC